MALQPRTRDRRGAAGRRQRPGPGPLRSGQLPEHAVVDHPYTLATRVNLGHWRGVAGDAAGVAALFVELLDDQLRVLGPNHPDTLTTRDNLDYWRDGT